MSAGFPVAFYAPLKPPDHATPSGDREMARLMLRLIGRCGGRPELASRLRSYDGKGDPAGAVARIVEADREAARLVEACRARPAAERPALWFTYHVYYKAPDLIGPRVARALAIPYVVAEGSRASKRAGGPWALGHAQAEAALDAADLILILNPRDRPALEAARPAHQRLALLPPFLDEADWPTAMTAPARSEDGGLRFLTVAMMRPGDKLASYRLLAEALAQIKATDWRLDIVGDGPARPEVEALFARFGQRVRLHGLIEDRAALGRFYCDADLLLWPAVNEAFGMVFLEAGLHGLPAVAGDFGGVGAVVLDGETGVLTSPGDAGAYAAAVGRLCADAALRRRLGAAARAFVRTQRSLDSAAAACDALLGDLLGRRSGA